MLELKTIIKMDMETAEEMFAGLESCIDMVEDEQPVGIFTEDETYVVMTAEDFTYLKNSHTPTSVFSLSCDMIDELETLSIGELEIILSLVSSQLNIKMARQYAGKQEV